MILALAHKLWKTW